ncbi:MULTISPECIES: hypothetical protein [unclassified Mesorhizobium]|uniref:hypothetical protein n=1 Tax=unclassified Mesorhizobium TaxID=325217 RepID=UPI00163D8F12|nr:MULTISPECIES: hypothetical protein [unclassified Mesorhizobium]
MRDLIDAVLWWPHASHRKAFERWSKLDFELAKARLRELAERPSPRQRIVE